MAAQDLLRNKVTETPTIYASFQDVLGKNDAGGIKATNKWIQTVNWDCIVLDEYHYGAWGKNAKNYYDKKDPALRRAEEVGEIITEAAFRVQSPWTTKDESGEEVILKPLCYVFDFAPNRALRQVQEYSCQLNVHESNPEKIVFGSDFRVR